MVSVVSEKPTAAFVLSLIAGILGLIFSILLTIALSVASWMVSTVGAPMGLGGLGTLIIAIGIWYVIASILIIVGAIWINTGEPGKVKNGGIIVLVFSILSIGNAYFLVFILGLIGGILALTWKPPKKAPPPPPA